MKGYGWMLLTLAFFTCISCKKTAHPDEPVNPLAVPLIGTWNWVLQYYSFYPSNFSANPLTPANTGISETLTFNTNGQWRVVRNGVYFSGGTYKIDSIDVPGSFSGLMPCLDLVHDNGIDSLVDHVFYGDTLIISNMEIVTVGINNVYVRQQGAIQQAPR